MHARDSIYELMVRYGNLSQLHVIYQSVTKPYEKYLF